MEDGSKMTKLSAMSMISLISIPLVTIGCIISSEKPLKLDGPLTVLAIHTLK